MLKTDIFYNPVIKRSMILKFQSTDRMCHSLNSILYRMSKIIHRINTPLITRVVVIHMCNSVNYRISHVDVRRSHVDFSTKNLLTISVFSVLHFGKKLKVFLNRTVPVRALLSRNLKCSSVLLNLISR